MARNVSRRKCHTQRELREALLAAARRREIDVVVSRLWMGLSVVDLVSTLQEL
jgi:hypothetical protein